MNTKLKTAKGRKSPASNIKEVKMADVQQTNLEKVASANPAASSVRKATPKKQLIAVHDDEISLGAQLREADARQWGRDVNQLKAMATQENKHKELPGATADGKTALAR